jgi:hypothetical protein
MKNASFDGFLLEMNRFISSVDWDQRWLHALIVYFVCLLVAILLTRKRTSWQIGFFGMCLVQTFLAQFYNDLARSEWQRFASANYFGERGFFVSIMFGLPHVVLAVVCLVNLMVATASLAATVKQMEFKAKKTKKD